MASKTTPSKAKAPAKASTKQAAEEKGPVAPGSGVFAEQPEELLVDAPETDSDTDEDEDE